MLHESCYNFQMLYTKNFKKFWEDSLWRSRQKRSTIVFYCIVKFYWLQYHDLRYSQEAPKYCTTIHWWQYKAVAFINIISINYLQTSSLQPVFALLKWLLYSKSSVCGYDPLIAYIYFLVESSNFIIASCFVIKILRLLIRFYLNRYQNFSTN